MKNLQLTRQFVTRNGRTVSLARAKVEDALGKKLPRGAVTHHIDGNFWNDEKRNLVVCPNQSYHVLLHSRTRALEMCGNANWRWCNGCRKWGLPEKHKKCAGEELYNCIKGML